MGSVNNFVRNSVHRIEIKPILHPSIKNKKRNKMKDTKTAITILTAVRDAIKEAGAIPSGHLYAILSQFGITLEQYQTLIEKIKQTGKVTEMNNLLYWVE